MKQHKVNSLLLFVFAAVTLTAWGPAQEQAAGGQNGLTPDETRQISKEAFIYGFPLVDNYLTMYKQAIDTNGRAYEAPFNTVARSKGVATPEDTFVVTPNSDTPYSFLWMDLRTEPLVVTMPKIEKGRYYTGQMVDLYTFNFAYLGTRTDGNDGGTYLVAGPGWNGETPKGIQGVIHCETEFAYILFRTQLFGPADMVNVAAIQKGYTVQPLSKFLGQRLPLPPEQWTGRSLRRK